MLDQRPINYALIVFRTAVFPSSLAATKTGVAAFVVGSTSLQSRYTLVLFPSLGLVGVRCLLKHGSLIVIKSHLAAFSRQDATLPQRCV